MSQKIINGQKVSCIVPVLNEEDTISDFISSLYRQDYRPIELILVDGSSKDGTLGIINRKINELKDDQFSINIYKEKDLGNISSPANARNIGLDHANGEFVFFIDSDTCFIDDTTISKTIFEMGDKDFIIINFKPLIDTKLEEFISRTMKLCGVILYRKKFIGAKRFIPTLGFGEDREFLYRVFHDMYYPSRTKPSSSLIGRHYPHTNYELKKQSEWYGRTIVRYMKVIYIYKKEFFTQFFYTIYNILLGFFPIITIISVFFSVKLTSLFLSLFFVHTFVRFLKYKLNTMDHFVFLMWYSLYTGFFFIKGLNYSFHKKNNIGREK